MKEGLEAYGFAVDTYDSPARAVTEFVPGRYGLAIFDTTTPRMDGIDVLQEIRRRDGGVKICSLSRHETHYSERRIFLGWDANTPVQGPEKNESFGDCINSKPPHLVP